MNSLDAVNIIKNSKDKVILLDHESFGEGLVVMDYRLFPDGWFEIETSKLIFDVMEFETGQVSIRFASKFERYLKGI